MLAIADELGAPEAPAAAVCEEDEEEEEETSVEEPAAFASDELPVDGATDDFPAEVVLADVFPTISPRSAIDIPAIGPI